MCFRVSHDAVILLTTGIALKFVQRDYLRKYCGFVIVVLKIPHSCHTGNIEPTTDFLGGYDFLKGEDNLCNKAASNSVIAREKGVFLEESLATDATVTTFA